MPEANKLSWTARLYDKLVPSKREIFEKLSTAVHWADRKIPIGLRTLMGIPLMIGGILSFLPILGLWMLPVGAALVALDFPFLRRRLLRWIDRKKAQYRHQDDAHNDNDTPRKAAE